MMKMMSKLLQFFSIFLLLVLTWDDGVAGLVANIDRNQVTQGESFSLSLTESDVVSSDSPNWAPLAQHFDVLQTGVTKAVEIINGQRKDRTQWTALLVAKHPGRLEIPPIAVGNQQSQPLSIEVQSLPALGGASNQNNQGALNNQTIYMGRHAHSAHVGKSPIVLEAVVDQASPFVKQAVIYTVKLYSFSSIQSGRLLPPEISKGIVKPLGQETATQTTYQGRPAVLVQRQFAIVPEQSGAQVVTPARFEGEVLVAGGMPGSGFDPFDQLNQMGLGGLFTDSQPVVASAQPLSLQVKSEPAGFQGGLWLPAKNLHFEESWSGLDAAGQVAVGEPLSRKLHIDAEGILPEQLPALEMAPITHANSYPDAAIATSREINRQIYSQSERKFAIVPNQPGPLVIPAVQITWWDIDHNQWQHSVLPERTIQVTAVVQLTTNTSAVTGSNAQTGANAQSVNNQASHSSSVTNQQSNLSAQSAGNNAQNRTPNQPVVSTQTGTSFWWLWIVVGVLLLMWVLTLGGWITSHHTVRKVKKQLNPIDAAQQSARFASLNAAWQSFETTSRSGDAKALRNALLAWAQFYWPQEKIVGVSDVIKRLDEPTLVQQLQQLDACLYGRATEMPDFKELPKLLKQYLTDKNSNNAKKSKKAGEELASWLPPLYPSQ